MLGHVRHERGFRVGLVAQAVVRVGNDQRNARGGAELGENPQQNDRVEAAGHRHDQRPALRPEPVAEQGGLREFDERMQRAKARPTGFRGEDGNPGWGAPPRRIRVTGELALGAPFRGWVAWDPPA